MIRSEKRTEERTEKRTAGAIALVALASLGFGSISVLTTITIRAGTSLVSAMFWRYVVAFVVLTIVVALRTKGKPAFSPKLLIIGGLSQALVTYLSLSALDYISVSPLAFLFYTYPVWVTIVSAIRGIDGITPMRAVALLIALIGVGTIIGSPFDSHLNVIGIGLALASAVTYGILLPGLSTLQRGMDPMVSSLHVILGAGAAFAVGAAIQGGLGPPTNGTAIFGVTVLALASTIGAFWLLLAGMARLGPVRTAIVATVEPFFTMLLGAAVLGDHLNARTAIGGLLIGSAVIILQRTSSRAEESERATVAT